MGAFEDYVKQKKRGGGGSGSSSSADSSGKSSGSSSSSAPSVKDMSFDEYIKYKKTGKAPEPKQPALEDFANANPLSATVQSLTNQRDAIANATPGEFGKKDKYTDSMSQYMQRRGLAELDEAIQNQTAKERADAFRAGTDPITGTLLSPIGKPPQSQQIHDLLIDAATKKSNPTADAQGQAFRTLRAGAEADRKQAEIDRQIEDTTARIGMTNDPAELQRLDSQLANLRTQRDDLTKVQTTRDDLVNRATRAANPAEADAFYQRFAEQQARTAEQQTQLNDIWKRIDEIDNEAGWVTDAEQGLRLSEEKSALMDQAHQMLLDNPDLENPTGAARWQAGRGSLWQGANTIARGFSNTVDMLFGDFAQEIWNIIGLGAYDNPIKAINKSVNEEGKAFQEYYSTETRGDKAAEALNKYGPQVVAALPAVAMAYATAGTSAATTAGLETTAYLNGLGGAEQTAAVVGNAIKTMSTDPNFMMSFTQEAGNAYSAAKEEGMDDAEAAVYSLLYGYVSGMVEVGGTSEIAGGLQQQAKEVVAGPKGVIPGLVDYAKSIVGEMGEEISQGMLERGLKSFFGVDTALYSTDPNQNAIISPAEMAEEAKGAALVSAVLGGPGAVTNTVNSVRENRAAETVAPTAEAPAAQQTTENANPVADALLGTEPTVAKNATTARDLATIEEEITQTRNELDALRNLENSYWKSYDTSTGEVIWADASGSVVSEDVVAAKDNQIKALEERLDNLVEEADKANQQQPTEGRPSKVAEALIPENAPAAPAEPTVANNAPVENNAENSQQSSTEQSEGINTPAEAEAENVAETPQKENAETVPQAEEQEYTETQKRLGEYLGLGESIADEEIDTILDSRPMRNALKSFGFVFEEDMTPSEQRQAVRDFAKKIAEEGIPSEKAVTKAEQDREIRTREQELQYQLDKVNEELEAAIQQGDIEKRKALEKQRQRILRKTRRGKALSKITSKANDLTKTLTKAKESKYVPAEFVEATTEFIEALNEARVDRTSETKTAQRAAAKFDRIAQEFAKLKDAQTKLENDRGIAIGVGYDEDVAAAMEDCRKMLAETPLNLMDEDDLENIANTLTAMQHAISKARNFSLKGRKGTAAEIMQDLMRETQNEATGGDSLGTKYVDSMSRPETFFNKLGGWVKNSAWHGMYEMLNRGQKKAIDLKLQAQDMFSDLIAETKNYRTLRDEVKLNGLKDADGNVIPISRGMMLSLYMHLMNEQNTNHITGGGLTIADVADYYKNRHDKGFGVGRTRAAGMSAEMSDLNYQYRQAKATGDTALMEDIQDQMDVLRENEAERLQTLRSDIENQLTDYEKRFIEKAQSFFSWAQTNLNETTLDVYGFLKATVDNYFPIDSDPHHRQSTSSETETARNNKSLEQSGILKQRTNANNPIMLMDISDVLNDYINQMAQYSGLMPAIKTFNQIYKAQLAGNKTNVRDVLSAKFGNAAENYINNLIDDLQGSRKVKGGVLESMLSTTRGNFAASVLTLNARVALSQRASYFNAASVLGWRNLAAGLTMKKPDLGLIRQYSPLLQARTSDSKTQKFSDNRTDLQSQRDRITRKLGFMLNWINDADNDTVRSLWNAAEMKVQNETDLAEGTDAYYKEVGRLFDEAVERTQPGYEVMQRPDLLRDPSSLTRTLTMFMTQRLQNFNEVYDRIQQARKFGEDYENGLNGVTKADVAEANRSARNAVSGVITSSLALTIMKAGVDALLHRTKNYRDDETGELTPESVLLRIMDYTAESLASNVWLGAEAYQTGKRLINGGRYYGTSVPGIDTISDTVDNIIKVLRASEEKRPEALMKAAGSAAALFGGIPFDNAKGYVESVIKWAEDFQNQTFLESDANYTTAQNKRIVYDALTGGEDPRLFKVGDRYEQAMARMGDNAEANARDAVKAHYDAGDIDTVDAVAALTNIGFDNGMDTVRKWREKNKYDKFVEENPETSLNQTAYTRYNDSNDKPDFDTFDKAVSDMSGATGKTFGDITQSEATEYLAFSDIPEDQQEKIYNLMFPNAAKEYGEQDLVVASKQMGEEASLDTYNDIMSFIDEATAERANEYDTKGYNEVMSALLDYDAGDGVKDAAMARAGTKTNSVYQALREDGEMPANDALSLILGIDGTSTKNKKYLNNGSINQDELKAYFKEHPEEEAEIAIVWDSMEYKKNGKIFTWEDYANNGYKK